MLKFIVYLTPPTTATTTKSPTATFVRIIANFTADIKCGLFVESLVSSLARRFAAH